MNEDYITCPSCHEDIPFIIYEEDDTIVCDACDSVYRVRRKEIIGEQEDEG